MDNTGCGIQAEISWIDIDEYLTRANKCVNLYVLLSTFTM